MCKYFFKYCPCCKELTGTQFEAIQRPSNTPGDIYQQCGYFADCDTQKHYFAKQLLNCDMCEWYNHTTPCKDNVIPDCIIKHAQYMTDTELAARELS